MPPTASRPRHVPWEPRRCATTSAAAVVESGAAAVASPPTTDGAAARRIPYILDSNIPTRCRPTFVDLNGGTSRVERRLNERRLAVRIFWRTICLCTLVVCSNDRIGLEESG